MTTDRDGSPDATTVRVPRGGRSAGDSGSTSLFPTLVLRGPQPELPHHRRVPARLIIMAWVVLLMAAVLLSVNVVTWSALTARMDERVDRALNQETGEFEEFASVGIDPRTAEPFTDVGSLIRVHLERQYPDDSEILFGWVDEGASAETPRRRAGAPDGGEETTVAPGRIRQGQDPPHDLSADPEAVEAVLGSEDARGVLDTPAGPVEWQKVRALPPEGVEGPAGWFVIGYFTEEDRAATHATMGTIALVSTLGLLAAGTAAWWVAGRILAPVRLVRRTAAAIGEEDLTQRIEVSGRDDIAALAEQFNSMLDRLEGAFTAQRRFVDDAGHELRTPITIVRGHLELMGDSPEEREEVVRLVTDELDRMGRIVEDLLLLAKAQQPDFVRPEPVSLAELTSDIDAKIRPLGDRSWRLESVAEGTARLDPQRITQAMVQLAANAVRYGPEGSSVRIGSALVGSDVRLWVSDQGAGIPAEDHGRVFARFSRGGRTARGGDGGAGLGLAIVRAIAEAHHGRVDLRSTPGHGSTFTLVIPVDRTTGREHA
ncbi:cell wall metabolism sensor histidine kinase WalK [Nocardiopsis sp. MG754419]|uniref:sensor histidine kinase n=1 Tax=Nocardiopsis sp. MG754419 TaxID=2259865 RepID=UPI001BA85E45|nr:ATP-binding protein [Nocardiopsis sp. MG754419]MBR8741098.1 two-component sensor histidine kinase [Nocardiopsis sp. MG754419]